MLGKEREEAEGPGGPWRGKASRYGLMGEFSGKQFIIFP